MFLLRQSAADVRSRERCTFADTRTITLSYQFERRLEKVHEQTGRTVKLSQQGSGFEPLESTVADHSSDHRPVLLLDKGLIVLALGTTARDDDARLFAIHFKVSFMNTEWLSVPRPRSANGSCLRSSVSTVVNSSCSRTRSGAHSVQRVAMSVRMNVWTKLPRAEGPLRATRSASTKPGAGSPQSAERWMRIAKHLLQSEGAAGRYAHEHTESPIDRRRTHRQKFSANPWRQVVCPCRSSIQSRSAAAP